MRSKTGIRARTPGRTSQEAAKQPPIPTRLEVFQEPPPRAKLSLLPGPALPPALKATRTVPWPSDVLKEFKGFHRSKRPLKLVVRSLLRYHPPSGTDRASENAELYVLHGIRTIRVSWNMLPLNRNTRLPCHAMPCHAMPCHANTCGILRSQNLLP